MKTTINPTFRLLLVSLFVFGSIAKLSAQVTLLDQAVVTNDALTYNINPHGNCVKIYNGYVFYTWYRGDMTDRTLMVSRKKIGSGTWKHVELRWAGMASDENGEVQGQLSLVGGNVDTHLTTNIGICPIDSTVHIMYDHHNENLNYIRSKAGVAFGSDEEFSKSGFLPQQNYLIPGTIVNGVTYPDLFNNDDGEMFFERRLGAAVGGKIIMTYYNGKEWSPEKMIIQGTGDPVTQGERNFCYGSAYPINGEMYYSYSPRWAESPTEADEGVCLMNLGRYMDEKATTVDGKFYDLPVIDHAPFYIDDPAFNGTFGWAGGPQLAISPKGDIYMRVKPHDTDEYNYLRRAGETEFEISRNKGSLGTFYGNRMYKVSESGGYLTVKSCLAGTWEWTEDYKLNVGSDFGRTKIVLNNGYIAAVFKENKSGEKVPIHCFVFKIEKSEYTPQTIMMDAISEKTEGDADFALTATATSELPVALSSSNTNIARIVEGNMVKIMGVGTCDIIANQRGNGEYDNAPEVKKSLIVKANTAKQNQMISFNLATTNYVWGSGDIALSATAGSGLAVQYESTDTVVAVIVDGKVQVKRAGTCTINALQMGNASYNAAPIVGRELNVPMRKQVITVEALPDFTSGDKQYVIKATSNNPNAKLRYVCPNNQVAIVWRNNVRECLAAGSATITVSEEGDDYFTPAEVKVPIMVKVKTHVLPASIEAEHCTSKQGVDVARWSNSVFYLNSWGTNDYAEYTIDVPKDTVYEVDLYAASPATGKKLKIVSGSTTLATATLTKGPSLTVFKSTKVNINLKKGVQNIKIVGVVGGYNFDRMTITPSGGTVVDPGDGEEPGVPDYVKAQSYTISSSDGEQDPNVATNLYDGKIDDDHRWSVNGYPKSVVIDLGEEKEIIGTRVWTYQARAYQYKVEVSNSATDGFVQVVDQLNNTSSDLPFSNDFEVQKGRYVKLTVEGCHAYASTWVSINELVLIIKGETLGLSNAQGDNAALNVYPNPTSSSFSIELKDVQASEVQIFDLNGRMVYNQPYDNKSISLPLGVYVVKVMDINDKAYYQKLVVQ